VGALLLANGSPNAADCLWEFLLPLALLLVVAAGAFYTAPEERQSYAFWLLAAFPLVHGLKILYPFDPRHLLFSLLFFIGLASQSAVRIWPSASGKIVLILLALMWVRGLAAYYTSPYEIFHPQDYRSLWAEVSRSASEKDLCLANFGKGGNAAVRYYASRPGSNRVNPAYGPEYADLGGPWVLAQVEEHLQKGLGRRCLLLTNYRMEESFFTFMQELEQRYRFDVGTFGPEVQMIRIYGWKAHDGKHSDPADGNPPPEANR